MQGQIWNITFCHSLKMFPSRKMLQSYMCYCELSCLFYYCNHTTQLCGFSMMLIYQHLPFEPGRIKCSSPFLGGITDSCMFGKYNLTARKEYNWRWMVRYTIRCKKRPFKINSFLQWRRKTLQANDDINVWPNLMAKIKVIHVVCAVNQRLRITVRWAILNHG